MRSPALAIAWEIWRKNRPGFMAIFSAIPVWALLTRALTGPLQPAGDDTLAMIWPVLVLMIDVVPMWVSLLALGVMFCYTETDSQRGHARFPARLFTLPVRTSFLITWPMLCGIVVVVLAAVAWEKLVFTALPPLEWMPPHFMPLIFVAASMVLLPATVWSLPGFPGNRLIVLSLLLFGLVWLAAWPKAHAGDWPAEQVVLFERNSKLALAGISAVAYLAAWRAVERERRGGGTGWAALRMRLGKLAEALPRRNKAFRSSAAAQFWFEWRRSGVLLPFVVGFFMVLIMGPLSWIMKLAGPSFAADIHPEATAIMFCLTLALPLVLAFVIGKRHAEMELTPTAFQLLRPISRGELIRAKLRVAAASAALSWLLVLALTPLWLVLWCDTSLLERWWRSFQSHYSPVTSGVLVAVALIIAFALTWRWLVVSLYLGLWGRPKVFICATAASLFGGWLLLIFLANLLDHPKQLQQWTEVVPYLAVLVALKGAVAAWTLRKACRQALLTNRAILIHLGLWLGVTICFATFGGLLSGPTSVPPFVIVLAAMLVFPLGRVGLAPLALEANGHR